MVLWYNIWMYVDSITLPASQSATGNTKQTAHMLDARFDDADNI
jgi:hypothetical protein